MNWKAALMIIILGSLPIGLVFDAGCTTKTGSDKIGVIVTILPQVEMAKAVGGDKIDVTVMVPKGESPHSYAPVPSQMKAVADAEVYFKVGSGVEFETNHLETLKQQNSKMKIIDCSVGITMKSMDEHYGSEHYNETTNSSSTDEQDQDHEHTGDDPHIWLSVQNAKIMVRNICAGLIEVDAGNKEYYEKNRDEYLARLDALHQNISQILGPYKDRLFLVYHPSWGYFGDDYNLVQIAIEEGGQQPGPAGVTAIIEQAKDHGIKVVFVEPQFDTSSATTIAEEINGKVVSVNPLEENYIEAMRSVATKMADGFAE